MKYALAIDVGASSGRHILGWLENGTIHTEEVYRFPNAMIERNGHLCWDIDALYGHIETGIRRCAELHKQPSTVGIDTWGVDYVLLDENNQLVGDAVAYRDDRTQGMDAELERRMPFDELYYRTGIAKQSFNTVYQLMAAFGEHPEYRERAKRLLFMPCYLSYLLCGVAKNELTIASTSALVNPRYWNYDQAVLVAAGIPATLLSDRVAPAGTRLGKLDKRFGFDCDVLLPACHDTASAYIAVPSTGDDAAYLSSGTWSLLGVERKQPLLGCCSMESGFTNEGGFGGSIRYLRNIMGLWMLQSIRREQNERHSFAEMAEMALRGTAYAYTVDASDARFLAPESMIGEVNAALREQGAPLPANDEELYCCVTRSLAKAYAVAIRDLEALTGTTYRALHIVGGGCQNRVLNQWTADATRLPVYAGPVEGTALGNLMAQMITTKEFRSLSDARAALRAIIETTMYQPNDAL